MNLSWGRNGLEGRERVESVRGYMSQTAAATGSAKAPLIGLCLGALGVVFGDIGTSPLYAMRECLQHAPAIGMEAKVLGVLSLMFWALTFVVSFKYVFWITRADNCGEGGIFALLALTHKKTVEGRKRIGWATLVVLVGAALLYGDGVITPAISVLGAVEGLKSLSPDLERFVVPIAVVILAVLFWAQKKGTKVIGGIFGPVMLVWFVVLGGLGLWQLCQNPGVLRAVNPWYGYQLLAAAPLAITALLGAVVLTITGAEALYADMGHFGRKYIAFAWYAVAMPGLLLNYFGQGAYVLAHEGEFAPKVLSNPFFALAPEGAARVALIVLSCMAAVIASQALISGTFSLTRQAIQLGYFPRLKIIHTNAEHAGQIYLPLINTLLAIGSIWVVIDFKSSDKLAAAYGIAVTGTMVVTTYAFLRVTRINWGWVWWKSWSLCGLFYLVDLAFLFANAHKITDGGWLPIAMALIILAVMHTWKSGRNEIQEKVYGGAITEVELSSVAKSKSIVRVPGSAVFMVATPSGTPLALLHHLKANRCLQDTVVLLTIQTVEVPQIEDEERMSLESLGEGIWRAVGRYGYMESPDVSALVNRIAAQGVPVQAYGTTFYFNREMIITGGNARMWQWQKNLYAFLSRNATPIKDYYQILPTQIIEIGLPVQL